MYKSSFCILGLRRRICGKSCISPHNSTSTQKRTRYTYSVNISNDQNTQIICVHFVHRKTILVFFQPFMRSRFKILLYLETLWLVLGNEIAFWTAKLCFMHVSLYKTMALFKGVPEFPGTHWFSLNWWRNPSIFIKLVREPINFVQNLKNQPLGIHQLKLVTRPLQNSTVCAKFRLE